jgi:UDP-3-O-[3-hydroxymyristoyl] N-acetylglucosamine deacetylase
MATVIGIGDSYISTIEHLLSAIYTYGIDNIRIGVDNTELPVMDGSSISFTMLLDEAGIEDLDSNKKVLIIKKDIKVEQNNKFVSISPSIEATFNYEIEFNHPAIGRQHYNFNFSKQNYLENISRARTFGFLQEVQYLRSKGLALGGSLENAIVLDDKKILNSEGLRFTNEFVRHKILDAIGDLAVIGLPIIGEYKSFAGSHNLNHLLTKEILIDENNYEIVEMDSKFEKEFSLVYE